MSDKGLEYTYDTPEGYIEIDPSHYEEVGLTGFVKESTLNFFVKVVNDNVVSTLSMNRDAFLDEETTYESLLELNISNLKQNGFEVSNMTELKRNDGNRLTKCIVTNKKFKLISMFTTIGNLFTGASILASDNGSEAVLENFMKSIRFK